MSKDNNKIYFSNSPFANGHKVIDFVWSARLDKKFNLWMDFHLETDKYDEEEEYKDALDEIDDISQENAERSLWINYDHCIISSTYWHNKGIKIENDSKLDFADLNQKTFEVDPIPVDFDHEEELAFGISMLGNDTVAQHEITFLDSEEFGVFDIKWKGKIANTYLGETEFNYDFYVYMKNIKFNGIKIDSSLEKDKVIEFFKTKLVHFDDFELIETDDLELEDYILKIRKQED
ncbi:hypothetical protein SAMN05421738_11628 [Algoriella xinjiangensis]|uniref:Uncharacterized protein n=1 Tax=Algoriella xinjiangensis TaxID=684065 RepID=A0A1I5ABG1_9FLAO|nr:hypothetical protein [Algoriella xinjiangensis]SFN59795.1 hypothetical protein SAMN05421738_11628 [Algoriella xinjiangensis]VDH14606.1 Uncharacterised protein [Algoriella xinjiangensis]